MTFSFTDLRDDDTFFVLSCNIVTLFLKYCSFIFHHIIVFVCLFIEFHLRVFI